MAIYTDYGYRLRNSWFGSDKLIKNADPDKYFYSGYSTSFDVRRTFSLENRGFGKNVVISRADMSSSVHVDNNTKKDILILDKGPTHVLDDTTLTAEVE